MYLWVFCLFDVLKSIIANSPLKYPTQSQRPAIRYLSLYIADSMASGSILSNRGTIDLKFACCKGLSNSNSSLRRYFSHRVWKDVPLRAARLDISFAFFSPTLFFHALICFLLKSPVTE